jgi:hypothetical protein
MTGAKGGDVVGLVKQGFSSLEAHRKAAGTILLVTSQLEELRGVLTAVYPQEVTRPLLAALSRLDELRGRLRDELIRERPRHSPSVNSEVYYPEGERRST